MHILYKLVIACLISDCYTQSLIPIYGGCSTQYNDIEDTQKCTHTLYCRSYISEFLNTRHDVCSNLLSFADDYGNVDYYDPISIVLKHDENYDTLPHFVEFTANADKVYSLDLSENHYVSVPNLIHMQNLAVLKFSGCGLSTAKLSNTNELPALTELDYSQNTIDNIEIVPGEFDFKMLKTLNLSHNYLVNIPDAIFDMFANMESLDMSHNFLYVLDLMSFEGLRKLLHLNLSNNRIAELDSCLLRLRYLVTLDLSYNTIQTLKASDFGKLMNLQDLKLNSNEISAMEKTVFDHMSSLTAVDLRDNVLENIDQEMFVNTTKITTVYLSRNKFKMLPKNIFKGKIIFNFSIEGNELEGTLERGIFEGLTMVTELDLSGQHIVSVENNAFTGLQNLKTLLLNNNNVNSLSNDAFKGLQNLNCLDLSHNIIENMEIATEDLINLQILSLHHNEITHISNNNFAALASLQFLDLSYNNISHLGSHSFQSLQSLLNFKISNNPLSGSIEEKTFDGLSSLPSLDISGSLINSMNNGSLMGMALLRDLNVSHSNITEIQYNGLSFVSNIRSIDLSHNRLTVFEVNTTDLRNLNLLYLNNNKLQVISETLFNGMSVLITIDLSHNNIYDIHEKAFDTLDDIRNLDLSYNSKLQFDVSVVEKAHNLVQLVLSGTKSEVTFDAVNDIPLVKLEMSHSSIQNVSRLNLYKLQRLETILMSNNAIFKLEVGAFSNLTALKQLDLSYNNLSFIQPGVFKDSTYLNILNISHNKLVEINYGIFRGLSYLQVMDLSYNKINSLHRARFYDVEHLTTLIVDHNNIDFISEDEFLGTSLSSLSIGGNPLPCEILANIDKLGYALSITAINIDETNENVKGVTCNKGRHNSNSKLTATADERVKLLLDIRNLLYNASKGSIVKDDGKANFTFLTNLTQQQSTLNQKLSSVNNLTVALVNLNNYTNLILQQLNANSVNLTSAVISGNINTNLLLGKLLRELNTSGSVSRSTSTPISIEKNDGTLNNLTPFINNIERNLDKTIAVARQNILIDVDNKIERLKAKIESAILTTKTPYQEKLVEGNMQVMQKSSMFTEVCVGLILLILVGLVLFQVYKSKLYIPSGRSFTSSTRNIADSMESSHL